jgi:hypothetical protein
VKPAVPASGACSQRHWKSVSSVARTTR